MPEKTINGSTIHYIEAGQGKPVVLVHGFPLDGRIWAGQIKHLAERYRVIVPDLHGFGDSRAADPSSMQSMACDMHELCAQLNALPAAVGGLSMGGYVAMQWYRDYRADIAALMLLDTRAQADTLQGKAGRDQMVKLVEAQGAGAVADALMEKMLAPENFLANGEVARQLHQIMASQSVDAIRWSLVAMRDRLDSGALLASISCPTLLLFGQYDAITPPSTGEQLQSVIAGSQLQVIADAGHITTMEKPDEVAQTLRDFLEANY